MADKQKLKQEADGKTNFPRNYLIGAVVLVVVILIALAFLLSYFSATR